MYVCMYVCMYVIVANALPDMYEQAQGHTAPKDECGHMYQASMSACVITDTLHFQ